MLNENPRLRKNLRIFLDAMFSYKLSGFYEKRLAISRFETSINECNARERNYVKENPTNLRLKEVSCPDGFKAVQANDIKTGLKTFFNGGIILLHEKFHKIYGTENCPGTQEGLRYVK